MVGHMKKAQIINRLVNEKAFQFDNIKEKIGLNYLIYKFSGSENNVNYIGNYQTLLKLFKDLRNSGIKPKRSIKKSSKV